MYTYICTERGERDRERDGERDGEKDGGRERERWRESWRERDMEEENISHRLTENDLTVTTQLPRARALAKRTNAIASRLYQGNRISCIAVRVLQLNSRVSPLSLLTLEGGLCSQHLKTKLL